MEGPRPVRPEEFDSLMEMIDNVFEGYCPGMGAAFPLLFNHGNCGNLWVFEDKGRIVSHVGVRLDEIVILGCRLKIAGIGSVGTYKEYRGQGMATKCLDAAVANACREGASIVNISGSRSLYARFGAVKVGKSYVYNMPPGDAADGLFVQEATPEDIFKLERIYEREPVRYHRPLEDWRAVFEAMSAYSDGRRAVVYLVGDSDVATGYVYVTYGVWDGVSYARVQEFAGSRAHIVGALPAVAAMVEKESIELRVPDFDPVLRHAAEETGLPARADFLTHHTIKIADLKAFVTGIKPYIEERLGRSGAEGLSFRLGQDGVYEVLIGEDHMPFEPSAFTALALGTPERDDVDGTAFGGGLLGRIFPVPLPFAGFNYV